MKLDELVTIATFQIPYQADLAKGMLESAGFEVFLLGEHLGRPQLSSWGGPSSLLTGLTDQANTQVNPED
jgi:hypothetical protein